MSGSRHEIGLTGSSSGGGSAVTGRRITVSLYESDNVTKVRDLTTDLTGSREWTDPENLIGTASLQIPMFLPAADYSEMIPNVESLDLTRGRVLRFALDGVDRFPAIIRPRRQQWADPDGYKKMTRQVQCKGLLDEWNRAVLPVAPGAQFFKGGDTRHFGWMSVEADITGLDDISPAREVFRGGYTHPSPWLDLYGAVFLAGSYRYFIYDQTVDDTMSMSVHFAAADQIKPWCNGVPAGQTDDPPASAWLETTHVGAKLPAGVTRWGFEVLGLPGAPDPRWCATGFQVNDPTTGVMNGNTIKWRTGYSIGTTPYPWKGSATAQGPTVKQIIRSVLSQVQSEQGLLTDWVIDGEDDTVDSNGDVLPRIEHVPFQTGVPLATGFLVPLAKSWCDIGVSVAGKTLYVYGWRRRGTFHTNPSVVPVFSDNLWSPVEGRLANVISGSHEERLQ